MAKPERASYTSLDFANWDETRTLVLTPKFQRRGVWTDAARSFLLDTLLQGMPVPPIYLRVRQSDDKKKIIREVIDGQQRVASVLKFMRDEFKLSKSLPRPYAGKSFSQLTSREQDQIRQFSFACEVFQAIPDESVLEIFARLNTYSIPLNNQELRNGQYFGHFKQTAYRLAHTHVEFWRRHRIFSEKSIARMLEVEFTSELMIAELAGLQDKKKSINNFYEQYDEQFTDQKQVESRFSSTIDQIENSLGNTLNESEFRRPPLFYSLFCAVCHHTYGLPKLDTATAKKPLTADESKRLAAAVTKLSEVIELEKEQGRVSTAYAKFVSACLRQTDNIEPRRVRLTTLYREAFA